MKNPTNFAQLQQKQLENAMKFTQMAIDNTQRLLALQIETAKALFEEGARSTQALLAAQAPEEQLKLRQEFAQKSAEKIMGCINEIAQLTVKAQAELNRLVSEAITTGSQEWTQAMQSLGTNLPKMGSEDPMKAVQSAIDQSRAVLEQMSKMTTEAWQNMISGAQQTTQGGAKK
jgi:phasin family protein